MSINNRTCSRLIERRYIYISFFKLNILLKKNYTKHNVSPLMTFHSSQNSLNNFINYINNINIYQANCEKQT